MRRATASQRATIDGLIAAHLDEIYGYVAFRLAPNVDAAADVTQEVFRAALQGLPTGRDAAGTRAWLLGVARHKVVDHFRRRRFAAGSLEELPPAVMPVDPDSGPAADAAELARRERAAHVARVMRELPDEQSDLSRPSTSADSPSATSRAEPTGRRRPWNPPSPVPATPSDRACPRTS